VSRPRNDTQGLKAGPDGARNAALEGPLFHGIIGGNAGRKKIG
jgi:hypothetical protein